MITTKTIKSALSANSTDIPRGTVEHQDSNHSQLEKAKIHAFLNVQEALVAAKILGELSDLIAKLIEELNYDFYWAVNETSKIFSKVQEDSYDGDDLKDYDLGERDNSMEVDDTSSPVPSQHE
ncbi:unnamed protein product [Rhizophagus irregularis]|uniref:Uncharacterized protein n=1 Tax=Rhizophagus irregularis TaxID=588596 RepID=A0A915ZU52_9GLOM|nr:unnamed protein product [Rhizophagus irregularis]CAB5190709.1 unnamed protein product [Rhizophagus irregularis]CAB5388255.1 unnamed protein product [Rhizophagus irregularis]